MTAASAIALAAGMAATIGLMVWNGAGQIFDLLGVGGWALLTVPAFHLTTVVASALGWRCLMVAQGGRQPFARLLSARLLADAINALLPVAQVGGEVVRGQAMVRLGVPGAAAAAAIIVDLTVGLVTLVVFILGGLALTLGTAGGLSVLPLALGAGGFGLVIAAFYRFQRSQLPLRLAQFMERQVGGAAWPRLAGGAATLNAELTALYRRRGAVAAAALWHLLAWGLGALEMALAVALLGPAIGLREALIFEAVTQAFRNAGFAIPGALGVQEGGMVVAAAMIGLPAEVALTVSLVKRMRDLVLGIPMLLIWQAAAGCGLWRRVRGTSASG